jgi:nucleoside-diphosphate-sugar epimerase
MNEQPKTFLVTGATGVVGTYLTHLLLERRHHVRALVHRLDARSEGLSAVGAEIMEGDLLDLDSVSAATAASTGLTSAIRSPRACWRQPRSSPRPRAITVSVQS